MSRVMVAYETSLSQVWPWPLTFPAVCRLTLRVVATETSADVAVLWGWASWTLTSFLVSSLLLASSADPALCDSSIFAASSISGCFFTGCKSSSKFVHGHKWRNSIWKGTYHPLTQLFSFSFLELNVQISLPRCFFLYGISILLFFSMMIPNVGASVVKLLNRVSCFKSSAVNLELEPRLLWGHKLLILLQNH